MVWEARAVNIVRKRAGWVSDSSVIGPTGRRDVVSEEREEASEAESSGNEGIGVRGGDGGR